MTQSQSGSVSKSVVYLPGEQWVSASKYNGLNNNNAILIFEMMRVNTLKSRLTFH